MNEPTANVTEQELIDKAVAPRVTLESLEANIKTEHYFSAYDAALSSGQGEYIPEDLKLLTICVLTTQNGFSLLGQSACASPENFNKDIGQRLARKDAADKLWALMGYELKSKLMESR